MTPKETLLSTARFPRALSRRASLAATAVLALTLAACGGDSGNSDATGAATPGGSTGTGDAEAPAEQVDLTVGVIPILDVAPIYLGVQEGFFEDEGLNLTLELAQGGAASVPGVGSGQFQFGFSNTTSLLLAAQNNLGLKAIANGASATSDPMEDFHGLVVKADSPLQGFADLAGKRIGVNTLNNIHTTTVNEVIREAGGDPTGNTFVELPFPDMAQAVANGDVDAGVIVEPFLTMALNAGDRNLGSNLASVAEGMTVAMYFTSEAYAQENADIVERFTTAMNTSLTYANENPDAVREVLGTYTNIDPAVAAEVTLPAWPTEIDRASVEKLSELAQGDGMLTSAPDLDALLP